MESLVDAYRDVFAHGSPVDPRGWGEYALDKDNQTISIEDVYGLTKYTPVKELERNQIPHHKLFHPPLLVQKTIMQEMKKPGSAGSYCLDQSGEIVGFSWGWITTLIKLWEEKFNDFYAHSRLNCDEFLRTTCANSEYKLTPETPIFYWAEVGHTLPNRSLNLLQENMSSTLSQIDTSKSDVCIFSTDPKSPIFKIMIYGCGAKVICTVDDSQLVVMEASITEMSGTFGRNASGIRKKIFQAIKSKN